MIIKTHLPNDISTMKLILSHSKTDVNHKVNVHVDLEVFVVSILLFAAVKSIPEKIKLLLKHPKFKYSIYTMNKVLSEYHIPKENQYLIENEIRKLYRNWLEKAHYQQLPTVLITKIIQYVI